jgi:GNAT superfamily N-acetyltransferase
MSVVIQQLPKGDLVRFREIDRSEEATLHYRRIGTRLIPEPVKDSIPNFFEDGPHSRAELVARWQPVVDEGGILLGAFADGDLVGIALLGREVAPRVRQLALLFVSRAHRRRGVAGSLTDAMGRVGAGERRRSVVRVIGPDRFRSWVLLGTRLSLDGAVARALRRGAGRHPHAPVAGRRSSCVAAGGCRGRDCGHGALGLSSAPGSVGGRSGTEASGSTQVGQAVESHYGLRVRDL